MKKFFALLISTIAIALIILIPTKRVWSAPPFPTFEGVQSLITDAITDLNESINDLFDRTETLEERFSDLEERVEILENPPTPTPTPEPAMFSDEFDGSSIDTDLWEVFPNSGRYWFDNGYLVIDGGSLPGMPFFRARNNPFPENGSFEIEFGIQYLQVYPAGTGVSLSFELQENASNSQTWPNNPISYWQDNGGGGLRFLRHGNLAVNLGHMDTSYHVVKISYDGEKYLGYLDGVLRYTTPLTNRVGGLWFGHTYYSDLPGWTGFKIDYIRVTVP